MSINKDITNIGLINPYQWERARWRAAGFFVNEKANNLPCMGFIFHKSRYGENIFSQWQNQFGKADSFEEIRISIIQGLDTCEGIGYIIHLSSDPLQTLKRLESKSIKMDTKKVSVESLFQSMNPLPGSPHLSNFRKRYEKLGKYAIVPLRRSSLFRRKIRANLDLSIVKNQIYFRNLRDITEGDPDWPIFQSGILQAFDVKTKSKYGPFTAIKVVRWFSKLKP
ncbi:MAG: hypothetical protein MRK01_10645 [Candidatus Scalindua sp.]|nr:hypothetical protein [Candidatus Scalindua sp.]